MFGRKVAQPEPEFGDPYWDDCVPPEFKPIALPRERRRREPGLVARIPAVLIGAIQVVGICIAFAIIAAVLWLFASIWVATQPRAQVQVLPECVELARRENFPTDFLSQADLKRAKRRMLWLEIRHPFDPMVRDCRRAIRRAEQAMRN